MNYLVIGAGGTGGAIGGYLSRAGKEVTLIATGTHLAAMQKKGLHFETPDGAFTVPVNACTAEEYHETPDVVFVCVKGYSLEGIVPFLNRICQKNTVVIPILNIYGTGGRLQGQMEKAMVTDGCIYIASEIKEPGTILLSGSIFRVVFGPRQDTPRPVKDAMLPVLSAVCDDLKDAGILPVLSDSIERDALQKLSFVSPMAAAGAYYNVQAFALQAKGQMRSTFLSLVREIKALSDAMGVSLPEDIEAVNLKILDDLAPTATASMQRDLRDGKPTEMDGLIFEVVRLGKRYHVPTPVYEMVAEKFAPDAAVNH